MKTLSSPVMLMLCTALVVLGACDGQPPAAQPIAKAPDEAAANSDEPVADDSVAEEDLSEEDLADLAGLADPAFDPFVDILLVRKALRDLDAGILVDVALQMAEGERELGRERKGFSAESLLNVALRTASDSRDKEALARLAKAVVAMDKQELLEPIEVALKLADAPRKLDPGPQVPLRELTPEAMVLFKTFAREIKICRTICDRAGLDNLRVTIAQLDGLHIRQREYLTKKLIDGLAAVPAQPNPGTAALSLLAGISRQRDSGANADKQAAPQPSQR